MQNSASSPPPAPAASTFEEPTISKPSMTAATLTSAIGLMKDRATSAKNHFSPQIQNMKVLTSKRLEKYQPSIDKVKSSASAAATMGRERMQPAFSRVKEGSTQGWSMLKTKLASAAPVAEKFQTMGLHVVNDFLGDAAIEVLFVDDPATASCTFLLEYKNATTPEPTKIPRMLLSRSRSNTAGAPRPEAQLTSAERCFATPFILGNILLMCGDVRVLGHVSLVNNACRAFIRSEKRLWRFAVRYGDMPQSLRIGFWEHVAGVSKLRTSSELDFETYLQMAKSKGECTELILTDVRRTYGRVAPHKRTTKDKKEIVIDTEQELINQLSDILHALSGRFPDVGYCQGMDYIAAHVLDNVKKTSEAREALKMAQRAGDDALASPPTSPGRTSAQAATRLEVESAFWILVALFENYGLRQMFCPGLSKLQLHCYQTQRLFELACPSLAEHFENEKVMIEMFIVGWFQTLYLYLNVLPREALDRIWDIFLYENSWKMLLRVAVTLLHIAEPQITGKSIDQIMQFLNTFSGQSEELLAANVLISRALGIKITNSMLHKLTKQHTRRRKSLSR